LDYPSRPSTRVRRRAAVACWWKIWLRHRHPRSQPQKPDRVGSHV